MWLTEDICNSQNLDGFCYDIWGVSMDQKKRIQSNSFNSNLLSSICLFPSIFLWDLFFCVYFFFFFWKVHISFLYLYYNLFIVKCDCLECLWNEKKKCKERFYAFYVNKVYYILLAFLVCFHCDMKWVLVKEKGLRVDVVNNSQTLTVRWLAF